MLVDPPASVKYLQQTQRTERPSSSFALQPVDHLSGYEPSTQGLQLLPHFMLSARTAIKERFNSPGVPLRQESQKVSDLGCQGDGIRPGAVSTGRPYLVDEDVWSCVRHDLKREEVRVVLGSQRPGVNNVLNCLRRGSYGKYGGCGRDVNNQHVRIGEL